jgi:hypothetical protein
MQFAFWTLRNVPVANLLLPIDVFAIMVGCLCHDIDHPGNDNAFEQVSSSPLALLYNDVSVLENHHSATTFRILSNSDCDILCNLSPADRKKVRQSMISGILATDMTSHFSSMNMLKKRKGVGDALNVASQAAIRRGSAMSQSSDRSDASLTPFNFENDKDRQILVDMIVHSADLSGQAYPLPVAQVWEKRISLEFMNQASMLTKMQQPVPAYMQNLTDFPNRGKQQANFMTFVLMPWWHTMVKLFPAFAPAIQNLERNHQYWKDVASGTVTMPDVKLSDEGVLPPKLSLSTRGTHSSSFGSPRSLSTGTRRGGRSRSPATEKGESKSVPRVTTHLQDHHRYEVHILGWKLIATRRMGTNSTAVVYPTEVTDRTTGAITVTEHRFSAFSQLYTSIRSQNRNVMDFPVLPSKKVSLGAHSDQFLLSRLRGLETLMQELLNREMSSQAVLNFMQMSIQTQE